MTIDDFVRYMREVGYKEISPDFYYNKGAITFIYTNDHELFWAGWPATHADVAHDNNLPYTHDFDLFGRIGTDEDISFTLSETDGENLYKWMNANGVKLTPDIQNYKSKLISFWNSDKTNFDILPNCCDSLLRKGLVTDEDIVVTYIGVVDYVKNIKKGLQIKSVEPEQAKRIEQWKKLHLMRTNKKQIMQDLGLSPAGAKNAWQDELEKNGYLTPGQKWWAPYSEGISFKSWLQNRKF